MLNLTVKRSITSCNTPHDVFVYTQPIDDADPYLQTTSEQPMKTSHAERIEHLKAKTVLPIQADDHIADALRQIACGQFVELLQQELEVHRERNVLSLHQLTTTVTQLNCTISLLKPYMMDSKQAKKFHKRANKLHKRLQIIQHLDIMMRDLLVMGEGATDRRVIASVIARLDAQRLVAKQKLYRYLNSKKYHKFLDQFQLMLVQPLSEIIKDETKSKPSRVKDILPILVFRQLAKIGHCGSSTDISTISGCHTLISYFNILNMTLHGFESLLGNSVSEFGKESHPLRDALADIVQMTDRLNYLIHLPRISLDAEQVNTMKDYREDLRNRRQILQTKVPELFSAYETQTALRERLAIAVASIT